MKLYKKILEKLRIINRSDIIFYSKLALILGLFGYTILSVIMTLIYFPI